MSTVGEMSPATANYVAGYCIKKITGEHGELHYKRVDAQTGELISIPPEFGRMSLKPGIGAEWFAKYKSELHVHDAAIINGAKAPVPRYYDKLTERDSTDKNEELSYRRYIRSLTTLDDQTPERLEARETVAKAAINIKKRN